MTVVGNHEISGSGHQTCNISQTTIAASRAMANAHDCQRAQPMHLLASATCGVLTTNKHARIPNGAAAISGETVATWPVIVLMARAAAGVVHPAATASEPASRLSAVRFVWRLRWGARLVVDPFSLFSRVSVVVIVCVGIVSAPGLGLIETRTRPNAGRVACADGLGHGQEEHIAAGHRVIDPVWFQDRSSANLHPHESTAGQVVEDCSHG